MNNDLIRRMNFHGYVVENNMFYEVYGNRIMTLDQAIDWLKSLD